LKGGEELIIYVILIVASGVAYCEFMWWLLITNKRTPEYIQIMMKFFIGLNLLMAVSLQSWANLVFVTSLTLYYFVLIPYRISKN